MIAIGKFFRLKWFHRIPTGCDYRVQIAPY